jgi:predicted membrane protein
MKEITKEKIRTALMILGATTYLPILLLIRFAPLWIAIALFCVVLFFALFVIICNYKNRNRKLVNSGEQSLK